MEIQEPGVQPEVSKGRPPLLCLLSLAVSVTLLLPVPGIEASLGASPRLAWCALVWVATLSLPQAERGSARWSVGLGLGLCVLGLAAHLDRSRGVEVDALWAIAWPALLFAVLLAGAASKAQKTGTATRHALLWLLLLPGAPLISHALTSWGGAPPPGWLEFLAELSPLSWLAGCAAGDAPLPWLPLGVAVLLFTSAASAPETASEETT
ncbi:MAG: hypothetical protein MK291_03470 [Planctomycetes bacterium]|nr:hypothetical protein [Planctomycetota bacterium]